MCQTLESCDHPSVQQRIAAIIKQECSELSVASEDLADLSKSESQTHRDGRKGEGGRF